MNRINIDFNDLKQEIDGFGASGGGTSASHIQHDPHCEEILDLCFDRERGAGISILRNAIPDASPDIVEEPPRFSGISIEHEAGMFEFKYENDPQIWLMNEAKKRGCTQFISVPWSPPAWMKDNSNVIRGHLRKDMYRKFAEYLAAYIMGYKKHFDIDINAISVQNEPISPTSYSSCVWTAEELRDFIKFDLIPVFKENKITSKLVMSEASNFDFDLVEPLLDDEETSEFVEILSAHGYWRDPPLRYDRGFDEGKKIWQTEYCGLDKYDASMNDGIKWGRIIHEYLVTAECSAYFFWYLAHNYYDNNEALINIRPSENEMCINKRFWVFASFSRFIRPGYVRVGAKTIETDGVKITTERDPEVVLPPRNEIKTYFRDALPAVYISAYKSPDGEAIIIEAVNDTSAEVEIEADIINANPGEFELYRTSEKENLEKIGRSCTHDGKLMLKLAAKSVTAYVS